MGTQGMPLMNGCKSVVCVSQWYRQMERVDPPRVTNSWWCSTLTICQHPFLVVSWHNHDTDCHLHILDPRTPGTVVLVSEQSRKHQSVGADASASSLSLEGTELEKTRFYELTEHGVQKYWVVRAPKALHTSLMYKYRYLSFRSTTRRRFEGTPPRTSPVTTDCAPNWVHRGTLYSIYVYVYMYTIVRKTRACKKIRNVIFQKEQDHAGFHLWRLWWPVWLDCSLCGGPCQRNLWCSHQGNKTIWCTSSSYAGSLLCHVTLWESLHSWFYTLILVIALTPSLSFQSYKTLVLFATCWLVIFMGIEVRWTPWGIVSGFLWVTGGCGGVFAIRNAGMAVAVGTWASAMVMMNFFWGILIFQEPVHNFWATCCAFLLLGTGVVGMSRYSAPSTPPPTDSWVEDTVGHVPLIVSEDEGLRQRNSVDEARPFDTKPITKELKIPLFGGTLAMTRRQLGILGAIMNGMVAGSSLIPLHYAKKDGFGGATYMISYACGSMIANGALWLLFFLFFLYQSAGGFSLAWEKMPDWHFRKIWFPGLCAGFLLSISIFGSILAVTYLGQGVGNSIVQTKILISGLWGICWYKEITDRSAILKWFISAAVTISGVIWLSLERKSGGH